MDFDDSCADGRSDWTSNASTDYDSDGCQDATEDEDDDDDLINDSDDNCHLSSTLDWNTDETGEDFDHDGCRDSNEDDDDDGDGVLDTDDTCLATPRGAEVDSDGCQTSFTDTDADGVADSVDECPGTESGTEVYWNGCQIDNAMEDDDNDGIVNMDDNCFDGRSDWTSTSTNDYDSDGCQDATEDWDDDNDNMGDQEDMCPTGALNWDVFDSSNPDNDFDGCRDSDEDTDDDNDGYSDSEDTCPLSRRGAIVDETGCETSFPDDDGDGVANDYDSCGNTENGTEVDWQGCDTWYDQDNDGVQDSEDDCLNTLEGEEVDENGCVPLDADADNDGVRDTEDDCLGTLPGVEVDANGCFVDSSFNNTDDEEDLLKDDWYTDIPVIGALLEQAKSKYGKYAGIAVIVLTALGYLYRLITMRSAYKMDRRVKKFKKQINKAQSARELRQIQADLEKADEKKLLPRGALGDLLSLIELRAEDLGLTDFIPKEVSVQSSMSGDVNEEMAALGQARNDLAKAQYELEAGRSRNNGPPGMSRRAAPEVVATATLKGAGKGGGGVKRPSFHPKDLNRDGSVDDDDEEVWSQMSQSERDAKRHDSTRKQSNIASQVVGFSKLPKSLKARCHCGKKKPYFKCHFKKDKCPCGSGKKFYQCCAKSRGY